MENNKLYQQEQKEIWENVNYRMNEEGIEYCFMKYSDFNEVKDEKFHELREKYIKSLEELKLYVENKLFDLCIPVICRE